jgi:tetratricopeptide (TPR) repeat protein
VPPFFACRAARIGLALTVIVTGAIGLLPLFEGPGYESALATGLVVPSIAAAVTALEVRRASPRPRDALARGLANGAALAAAAFAGMLLHGLRAGFCDALAGSAHVALGPGAGALLGGAWGAAAGELARLGPGRARPRGAAIALAIAGPLASALVSIARFYTSPMVFAYDPFAGFFSGTLYDTVIDGSGLETYRAGTAATLLALAALSVTLARRDDGALALASPFPRGAAIVAALAGAASVAHSLSGTSLGHYQTTGSIARALGGERRGERCDVIHPRAMRASEVERFTRDCDALVRVEERWLGLADRDPGEAAPRRVRAFLFESAAQKGALMGASGTQIAKPWRGEIYVHASGFPHPSLGHEIAHVLAGSLARGPFRVAGAWGGLLPDPGLIEGIAVAAAPPDSDLLPREWAKAMKDLGLLPPLDRLFALGFLAESSSTAYTASGAFVGFVRERFGAGALASWYGGAGPAEATGVAWPELERAFLEDLDRVELPEAARAQARARFDRPAVFARRCPHVVDAVTAEGDGLAGAGDAAGAIEAYDCALALDPRSGGLRVSRATSQLAAGRRDEALAALASVAADEGAPGQARDRAIEALGDEALREGDGPRAVARYRELAARTVDEDRLRTLDVKIRAAEDPAARPAVIALLLGERGRGPDRVRAAELLARWSGDAPDDGLPLYLLARYYVGAGALDEAAERLDRALARRLAIDRVAAEALRLRAIVASGRGEPDVAARALAAYAALPGPSAARKQALAHLVERSTPAALP